MIKVLGHWEIGYMTPIMEAHHWNLILREFAIKDWLMSPVTGIKHLEESRVNLIEFHSFDDALENEKLPRVFLEPRTSHHNPETTWLHDFVHPEECIYIFGSAHFNPSLGRLKEQDHVVSIKTIIDNGVPWAYQCLFVVLYDRMMKS